MSYFLIRSWNGLTHTQIVHGDRLPMTVMEEIAGQRAIALPLSAAQAPDLDRLNTLFAPAIRSFGEAHGA